jgi:hypothetical protein
MDVSQVSRDSSASRSGGTASEVPAPAFEMSLAGVIVADRLQDGASDHQCGVSLWVYMMSSSCSLVRLQAPGVDVDLLSPVCPVAAA